MFGPSGFRHTPLDHLEAEPVYASLAPPRMRFPASQVIGYPPDVIDPLKLGQVEFDDNSLQVALLMLTVSMVTPQVKILPTLLRSIISQSVGCLFHGTRRHEGSQYTPCLLWLPT